MRVAAREIDAAPCQLKQEKEREKRQHYGRARARVFVAQPSDQNDQRKADRDGQNVKGAPLTTDNGIGGINTIKPIVKRNGHDKTPLSVENDKKVRSSHVVTRSHTVSMQQYCNYITHFSTCQPIKTNCLAYCYSVIAVTHEKEIKKTPRPLAFFFHLYYNELLFDQKER